MPHIKLSINGKIVFKTENKQKNENELSEFMNRGECHQEFIMLSDNAQIKVICIGELVTEGFLNLKRLW